MKKIIKSLLAKVSPDLFYTISSYRFFLSCRKRFFYFQNNFAEKIFGNNDITILNGPFKGIKYFNRIVWGPITPKWLGSYEEELHTIVNEIINTGYEVIIDVGAAEGYYAIGFAYKCSPANVFSFDVDPIARRRQKELSSLNKINNLQIGRYCTHEILSEILTENSLLFCDIEGYEYELLNPEKVPKLGFTDILVELHPFKHRTAQEVKDNLVRRFGGSHVIYEIPISPRDVINYRSSIPRFEKIDDRVIGDAMKEYRSGSLGWLWMKAEKRTHVKG